MRIGYLLDVNDGLYDQPAPTRDDVVAKLDAMIEEGLAADRAGFHSVNVPDRHGRTETYFPGPLQLLTILARETDRVALGTFCLVSTLVHPMAVMEQAAIVDNLSRGRFFLALVRGYHTGYWDYFGVTQERMLRRHKEAVRIVQLAMPGERFSFDGEFYSVRNSLLSPKPYQPAGFPVWGGGDSLAAMLRGVEYGSAWPASPFPIYRPLWDERMRAYREKCRRHSKVPFVALIRDGWVDDSFDAACKSIGEHSVREMRFYQRLGILEQVHPYFDREDKITTDSMREHWIMGSKQECIEQIEMYEKDLSVDYLVLRFRMPTGPSFEAVREQIARFGDEVLPSFHGAGSTPCRHPAIPVAAQW